MRSKLVKRKNGISSKITVKDSQCSLCRKLKSAELWTFSPKNWNQLIHSSKTFTKTCGSIGISYLLLLLAYSVRTNVVL